MCYLFIFVCLCLHACCVCVVMSSQNVVFTALIILFLHRGFTRSSILALIHLCTCVYGLSLFDVAMNDFLLECQFSLASRDSLNISETHYFYFSFILLFSPSFFFLFSLPFFFFLPPPPSVFSGCVLNSQTLRYFN